MAEAAGWRVHVYTSPHLVRFNERIRLAGELVSDADFAAALDEVEAKNAGGEITVFEALTAAAFWLFARVPADLCLLEVGLGGRFDATNVIAPPRVAALTSVSLDHQEFLGDSLAGIAGEKAGIVKPGCVAITGRQAPEVLDVFLAAAREAGVKLFSRGRDWDVAQVGEALVFEGMRLPLPALAGAHQVDNAGIAIMALQHCGLAVPQAAIAAGLRNAVWPARLQRLHGALAALLPPGSELWLDGAHNPGGGAALAAQLDAWAGPTTLVVGMKQSKDVKEFLTPLVARANKILAVAEPGQHAALPVDKVIAASGGVAVAGPDVAGALRQIAEPARVLICGSLYLAGEVLKLDGGG
jgi:dihydrofolate synthase/folylpolyglutamate synthase